MYSMNPCCRKRFMKKLTRERVVPIISASVSWVVFGMSEVTDSKFDITTFLSSAGLGRHLVRLSAKQAFFSQGDPADCAFYLQAGRAKLTVVSAVGKEAIISLIAAGLTAVVILLLLKVI